MVRNPAAFGAVLGENRLRRSYDYLSWAIWGWTAVIGYDVVNVREVIESFGNNIITLCELENGNEAIYYSPNQGDKWSKALEVWDIWDITSVGYNWTLASTSAGIYCSLKAGSEWDLIAPAGPTVPMAKSMVWVKPNHLFAHDGSKIWLSEDKGYTWTVVCDLTTFAGYSQNKEFVSIDGYQGRVIATNGFGLVETIDLGSSWASIDLSTAIRSWNFISGEEPLWRQIAFWDTLDPIDPTKSRWMLSAIMSGPNLIRSFVNRGTGIFSPVVDMAISSRHRLNISSVAVMGSNVTTHLLMITGERWVEGALLQALTVSSDGVLFRDILAGGLKGNPIESNHVIDLANAELGKLVI